MVSKGFLSRVILLLLCSVIFTCTVTFFLNSSSTFSFSSSSSSSSSSLSSSPSSLSSHYYQLWSASVLETKSRESGQTFSELHQSDSDNKKEAIDKLLVSKLPPSTQLTNEQTYALVEATSNLALFYWDSWQNLSSSSESSRTSTCTSAVHFCHSIKLPSPFELRQTNRFWQQFDSNYLNSTVTLHLLNAYYDGRPETELLGPKVRLLGVTKEAPAALDKHRKWSCLLWFADLRSPVLVQASEYHNIFPRKWQPHVEAGTYHPALITCPLPVELQDRLPAAVSLVNAQSGRCSGLTGKNLPVVSNVLRVLHSKANPQNSTKKPPSFGVCVQALRFATYEQSVRLVEWLEWMRLLGAEKVYLYVLGLTEHMRAVLNSYADEGLLDWREFTLPGEQPNLGPLYNLAAYHLYMRFWPQELIELNDCLYRNLDRHEYLAVIDIDEVILPQKEGVKDWSSLLQELEESVGEEEFRRKAFYNSRQSHVCEVFEDPKSTEGQKIPPYLYTLRHRRRGRPLEFNKQNKCIVRPSHVFTLHNHFPIHCLNGSRSEPLKGCDGLTFDPEDSVVLHFRRNISNPQFASRNWDCPVEERAVFVYAQELTERVRVKLADLFL